MKFVFSLLLVAFIAGIGVYFTMQVFDGDQAIEPVASGYPQLKTEADFRNKVAELKRDRQKLLQGIERLNREKAKTMQYLKDKGVHSSSDITDDKDIKYALNNLAGWRAEIDKLKKQVTKYDDTINSVMAMLDQLKRERIDQAVALSEEQLIDLRRIVVDLDERLEVSESDILKQEEWAKLLDEEMEADSNDSDQDESDGDNSDSN